MDYKIKLNLLYCHYTWVQRNYPGSLQTHAPTLKSCKEWGESGERGGNQGRGEGKKHTASRLRSLKEYNVEPGKKPQQHQEQQTLAHHPT